MSRKLIRVTDLGYTERGQDVIVRLVGRDELGNRSIHYVEGTRPCFWILEHETISEKYAEYVRSVDHGYEAFSGEELKKVEVYLPKYVSRMRESFEHTWEADIPYVRRVSVDYGLSGYLEVPDKKNIHVSDIEKREPDEVKSIEPRVFIADIETMPPKGGDFTGFVEDAPEPVLMITVYDTYDDEYTVFGLDPDNKINGEEVREHMEKHWYDHEDYSKYIDCNITLKKASSEPDLLNSFISHVESKGPDLLSGWNWVKFDHMYLLNRMKQFESVNRRRLSDVDSVGGRSMERKIDGLPGFDMMEAYCGQMTFHDWRSQSLDYISGEVLGVGKVEDIDIRDSFENNRSRLLAYNIIDVQLCVGINDINRIHEFFYQLADLSGVQIYDTFSAMRLVDGFIMSRRGDDEILPSMEEKDLDENAGGLVLRPSDGISEWVAVLDLKSLYPSAFITCNVSTETMTKNEGNVDVIVPWMPEKEDDVAGGTITEDHVEWDIDRGMGLTLDKEGIIPKYLKLIFDERSSLKAERNKYDKMSDEYEVWDNRQRAVKVVMNSFYGVSSNDYWRLSAPEMGDTITAAARYVTWRGVRIAEEMGYEVRYGDTDSIMIELAKEDEDISPSEVVKRGEEIEREINDRLDDIAEDMGIGEEHPYLSGSDLHGTDRHCFVFEFEKLYRRFLQTGSKKRYAGLLYWSEGKWLVDPDTGSGDAELDVTGYEAKRSDVPEITEEVQKMIMELILDGKRFDTVSDYVRDVVEKIEKDELPLRRIGMPGAINKPLDEYPNREVPRACEYMNRHMGYNWSEGDDPWIYYVDSTPPMDPFTNVIALKWNENVPEGFSLDKSKHIEKYVEDPVEPILEEIGWTMNELKTGKRSQSIYIGSQGATFDSMGSTDVVDTDNIFSDKKEDSEDNGGALDW